MPQEFLTTHRPFIQKNFTFIFLLITGWIFFLITIMSDGLSSISLFVTMVLILVYGLIVGQLARKKYKESGYIFGKPLTRVIFSLIAVILIYSLTYELADAPGYGDENIILILLNLPHYHYLHDGILDASNTIWQALWWAMITLMASSCVILTKDKAPVV